MEIVNPRTRDIRKSEETPEGTRVTQEIALLSVAEEDRVGISKQVSRLHAFSADIAISVEFPIGVVETGVKDIRKFPKIPERISIALRDRG